MIDNSTIENLRRFLPRYVDQIAERDIPAGPNKYKCPIPGCKSGHGGRNSDGAFTVYPETNSFTCYSCHNSGDIFSLIGKVENIGDFPGQVQRAAEIFNVSVENVPAGGPSLNEQKQGNTNTRSEKQALKTRLNAESDNSAPDFTEYFEKCFDDLYRDQAGFDYLEKRGITENSAIRFLIGYDPGKRSIIIPCGKSYYAARNIDVESGGKGRFKNPAGVHSTLFNDQALYNDDGQPVFITESAINAISIMQSVDGSAAVALNSADNYKKLLAILDDKPTQNTLIISLDNDDQGRESCAALADGLRAKDVKFIIANIAGELNDANDAMLSDPVAFAETIRKTERKTAKPYNTKDYILRDMDAEMQRLREHSNIKTGFDNLDQELTALYPGLICIGGQPSIGKTSFAVQMCDNIAAAGTPCIYFSLEQSRLEIIAKSLSRYTLKASQDILERDAVSSSKIRKGEIDPELLDKAKTAYIKKYDDRINIVESNLNCDIRAIGDYIGDYIRQNRELPVVFCDYLQIISPATDPRTNRKTSDPRLITNEIMTELKRLSRRYEIPIIVLSSLNRGGYLTPIDFESFRESSGIEYSCDVLMGLQLSAVNEELFSSDEEKVSKRERLAQEKKRNPRNVQVIGLKNRYGESRFTCEFKYYPAFDYFEPIETE